MITMDYIVQPSKDFRENFYDYLIDINYRPIHFSKEDFVNMPYPFTINNKLKVFSLLKSITCCAMASMNNKIISVDEYMEIIIKN